MRIFLLPLTTRQALIYCQKLSSKAPKELTYADRITKKAADKWAEWEQAEKGWQKQLVTYGNRGLKRIPYQEWGLKSFPPLNATVQAKLLTEDKKVDVVYPTSIVRQEDVPKVLARLAKERKQLHWNRFVGSMVAMPFTIPFALIPIIPNIPFFYAAYRCWSHWRALKGSDHLDFILDHRLINPISTPEVEKIYKQYAPKLQNSFTFVTRSQVEEGTDPEEQVLLPAGAHTSIAKSLDVPELSGEVERASWQVKRAMKAAQEQQQQQQQQGKIQSTGQTSSEKVSEQTKEKV